MTDNPFDIEVYAPAVQEKRKLKNGSYSTKAKPLFPGNKQINKPRPVSVDDMEAIFRKAKEEQERTDQAFEEEQKASAILKAEKTDLESIISSDGSSESATKPLKKSRKTSAKDGGSLKKENVGFLPGSTVRVLSGTFAGFGGNIKSLIASQKRNQ